MIARREFWWWFKFNSHYDLWKVDAIKGFSSWKIVASNSKREREALSLTLLLAFESLFDIWRVSLTFQLILLDNLKLDTWRVIPQKRRIFILSINQIFIQILSEFFPLLVLCCFACDIEEESIIYLWFLGDEASANSEIEDQIFIFT
jgi:hypothetical protein